MRTSSRVRVALLLPTICWALAAATASAQDVLYLRSGGLLLPDAPPPGAVTAAISMRVPAGEDFLLGSFTSAPLDHELDLIEARGVVYLATGRPGMDGCARVTMSLSRLTGAARADVASGSLVTTLRSRRKVTDPITVPMAIATPLAAAPGDRLVFDVRVGNDCGGERSVFLLYASVGRASHLELLPVGVTTTTTTSTTTTTTLPPTCLDVATGLAGVRCRLEAMDGIIRATSPASLGGARFAARLSGRVDRALTFVRGAELIEATPRRLRKGRRQLVRFTTQLGRGRGDGRVAPDPGDTLGSLAQGATSGLESLLGGS
jgi:hypothetical protein